MDIKRIEKEFEIFCEACFSPDISKLQKIDLKRTFYGGIAAFIVITYKSDINKSDEDLMSDIQEELFRFNEDVKAGKA